MVRRSHIRPGVAVKNDFGIDHLLIHTAELYRPRRVKNPAAGWTETWTKVSDVTCRFTVYNPRDIEVVDEQKVSYPTLYKVITFGNEDVQEKDRFVFKGRHFNVVSPPLDPSFLGHHLEIQVEETSKEILKGV